MNTKMNYSKNEFRFDLGDVVYIDFGKTRSDGVGLIVEKVKYMENRVFYNVLINSMTTWVHENNLNRV